MTSIEDKMEILEEKMNNLESKIINIDKSLSRILSILTDDLGTDCKKMSKHIDFIENVYDNVKYPLDYVCTKFNTFNTLLPTPQEGETRAYLDADLGADLDADLDTELDTDLDTELDRLDQPHILFTI